MTSKLYTNKAWLFNRYFSQHKTVDEIAEEAGCTPQTIYVYLRKYHML
jgi:predicted transcriptional regulator